MKRLRGKYKCTPPETCTVFPKVACSSRLHVLQGCMFLKVGCSSRLHVPQGCMFLKVACSSRLHFPQGWMFLKLVCFSRLHVPKGCMFLTVVCSSRLHIAEASKVHISLKEACLSGLNVPQVTCSSENTYSTKEHYFWHKMHLERMCIIHTTFIQNTSVIFWYI